MASEKAGAAAARLGRALLTLARWALAAMLAVGALLFLLHGRALFARLGRPDGARIALCGAEILGAILFLFRRTLAAGAALLLAVLAWAAGFHFALGQATRALWLDMLALIAIAAATQAFERREARGI